MKIAQKLITCIWCNNNAEEAANFYVSVFKDASIGNITHYTDAGKEFHGHDAGDVLTIELTLFSRDFVLLNGGPLFQFNEAISFTILVDSQEEIDYYWEKLTEGGEEGPCGWLKDKFGMSWQVVPVQLNQMLKDKDTARIERVTTAYMKMKKFDLQKLHNAFDGK